MVLLCFVLDLRSLSPPVLRDLKQVRSNAQALQFEGLFCKKFFSRSESYSSSIRRWEILEIGQYVWFWQNSICDGLIFALLCQSLLQLANYYAISSPKVDSRVDETQSISKPLPDRIGLCYIQRNRITCSDEVFSSTILNHVLFICVLCSEIAMVVSLIPFMVFACSMQV